MLSLPAQNKPALSHNLVVFICSTPYTPCLHPVMGASSANYAAKLCEHLLDVIDLFLVRYPTPGGSKSDHHGEVVEGLQTASRVDR